MTLEDVTFWKNLVRQLSDTTASSDRDSVDLPLKIAIPFRSFFQRSGT